MKFSFSSEQEEFRSNLRRLLADRSPTKEVRRLMETDQGYERDGWRAIDTALGLTAIRIPEAYGGYGLGLGDSSASSPLDLPSVSSACTPPSTTPSICNATSSPDPHCGSSEPKLPHSGKVLSQRHDAWRVWLLMRARSRCRDKAEWSHGQCSVPLPDARG